MFPYNISIEYEISLRLGIWGNRLTGCIPESLWQVQTDSELPLCR